MKNIFAAVASVLFFASVPSVSNAQPADASPDSSYEGIPYIDGGVGEEDLSRMMERAKEFNLKLVFSEKSGAYLADVAVSIADKNGGKVFELGAAGPVVLVKLPPANYRVSVTFDGQVKTRSVALGGKKHSSMSFYW